jgi:hypothetical protein
MADGNRRGDRPDAGKIARDAGAEIGDAITRVGQAAGTALIRAGELASDALLEFFGRPGGGLVTDVLPELAPLLPVQAGDEVQTRVRLVNGDAGASDPFSLSATELVSDAGDRIAADAIVLPSHQRVLAGQTSDTVPVTVKVPSDAKPGVYSGELRSDGAGVAPVPVVIEVR